MADSYDFNPVVTGDPLVDDYHETFARVLQLRKQVAEMLKDASALAREQARALWDTSTDEARTAIGHAQEKDWVKAVERISDSRSIMEQLKKSLS